MRFRHSEQWTAAREDHRSAYFTWDAFAEAGNDGVRFGGTQASDDAAAAEVAALDAALLTAAVTPLDVADKFKLMEERDVTASWESHWPRYMAQIQRDLFELQRPACSPEMKALFDAWVDGRRAYFAAMNGSASDEDLEPHCAVETETVKALMEVPCLAPGDFIVKAYVEWIDTGGSTGQTPGGSIFEMGVETSEYDHDHFCLQAKRRDILDTDIGRCMSCLGRVDFDARAWVEAALGCGVRPSLVLDADGRQFGCPMNAENDGAEERWRMLMYLLGAAGGPGRSEAVADEIEDNWPELVWRSNAGAREVAA